MKKTYTIPALVALGLVACDLAEKVDDAIIDISGQVSNAGVAVSGAIVLLLEGTDISEINLANGSITDNSGRYVILNVDPGDYYVLAVDDANDNLEFDVESDRLGFHGVDPSISDITPDLISVVDQDLEISILQVLFPNSWPLSNFSLTV